MGEQYHIPVLFNEVMTLLHLQPGLTVVDATLGGGGHSRGILERILPGGFLVGIDRDKDAIAAASRELSAFSGGFKLVCSNLRSIGETLDGLGITEVDRILFDFGVSSYQIDTEERGFSYMAGDAPLDMRMDRNQSTTAATLLNTLQEAELSKIISEYGEERYARRIARSICARRERHLFSKVSDLINAIEACVPRGTGSGHRAKRTFQALRIAVNDELAAVGEGLEAGFARLRASGILAAISFHSLEDRIVKHTMRQWARRCVCRPEMPVCQCRGRSLAESLTQKPVLPTKEEKSTNRRSHSAKLRAVRKF